MNGELSIKAPRAHIPLKKRLLLELHRQNRLRLIAEHPLRSLFWECTQRCNIACLHCGSDCTAGTDIPDMPAADFLRVIDSIKPHVDSHKVMIIITGGEPLVRRDLEEVGLALYRREFPWGIVTNGLALTDERLLSLRRAGIHAITISLDGLRDNHNWLRGNRMGFDRAMAAIKRVAATNDIKWDVVTCVNRRNLGELDALKEELIAAGVRDWRLFTIFPAGRAAGQPDLRLTPEEYRSLMEFIKATRAEGRIGANYCCEGFMGNYEGDVRDNFMSCHAGVTVGSVMINGDIGSCVSIRSGYAQGNIYTDDFMTVWNTRFEPYRNRAWMRDTEPCKSCRSFRYCMGNGMHLRDEDGRLMRCNLADLGE